MTEEHEFFSPERVDEQIDQLFQHETRPRFARQQARDTFQAEKRLIQDLQGHYHTAKQEDIASLERAWRLVSPRLAASTERSHVMARPFSSDKSKVSQERTLPMYNQGPERPQQKKTRRWPGMLAAVLVAVVLVGGLIAVLNQSNHAKTAGPAQTAIPTSQPTATLTQPMGTTVYTTPAGKEGYTGFYWSPDSKRIASITSDAGNGNLRIWDATIGGNAVTFSLPGSSEWIMAVAWSPVSQDLAVGTNKRLLIVDGQTGAILHAYTSNAATTGSFTSPYLNSLIPYSGGFGYRALGWSPDGKYLAAGISFGPSGSLQVWDIQTASVKYTLSFGTPYVITSAAWSSDGKYLAAHGFNTQSIGPDSSIVGVWDTSTHQTIFKKTILLDGSDAPIHWQPRSHNLVFFSTPDVNQPFTLGIWDVLTSQALHKYANKGSDALAFSPDGQQLAYDGFIGKGVSGSHVIMLMDVNSGAHIYTYKGSDGGALAWSPNGKYIVSASGGQQITNKNGQPVFKNGQPETTPSYAKVWIA